MASSRCFYPLERWPERETASGIDDDPNDLPGPRASFSSKAHKVYAGMARGNL